MQETGMVESNRALSLVRQSDALLPPIEVLKALQEQADFMVKANMLPPGYENGSQVIAIGLRGRELGCGIWESIQGMFPMSGGKGKGSRIGYMGTFMLAQIARRYPKSKHRITQNDEKGCIIQTSKNGNDEWIEVELTNAEAVAAGWDTTYEWDEAAKRKVPKAKHVWKARANMLYWRTVSRMTNRHYSDVFGQPVYTPEELDGNDVPEYIPPEKPLHHAPPYETAKSEPVVASAPTEGCERPGLNQGVKIPPEFVVPTTGEVEFPSPTVPEPVVPEVVAPAPIPPSTNKDGADPALLEWFKNALALCTTKEDVDKAFEELRPQANPATMTEAFPIKSNRIKELKSKGVNRA